MLTIPGPCLIRGVDVPRTAGYVRVGPKVLTDSLTKSSVKPEQLGQL
jgi:hypothetical protein